MNDRIVRKAVTDHKPDMLGGVVKLSAEPWEEGPMGVMQPKPVLSIPGLTQIGEGLFEIEGTTRREIDWQIMSKALGYSGPMDDLMCDEIAQAVFRVDILRVLAERVKLA